MICISITEEYKHLSLDIIPLKYFWFEKLKGVLPFLVIKEEFHISFKYKWSAIFNTVYSILDWLLPHFWWKCAQTLIDSIYPIVGLNDLLTYEWFIAENYSHVWERK